MKFKQIFKAVALALLAPWTGGAVAQFGSRAYQGSTELSSKQNPPRNVGVSLWGQRSTSVISSSKVRGQGLWLYNTTDSASELTSATYFLDAYYLGMKEGDLIMGACDTGSSIMVYLGVIGAVTTAGAAIASTGGQLSSTR